MTAVSWVFCSLWAGWGEVKVVRGLSSPGTSYHPDTEDTEDSEDRGEVWAVTLPRDWSSTEGLFSMRCWSTDLLLRDRIRLSRELQLSLYLDCDGDTKSSIIFACC